MTTVQAPKRARSRDQAAELVANIGSDHVVVDVSEIFVATPSFADELLKAVLERNTSSRLLVTSAPARFAKQLERAAERLGVADRLRVE